MSMIVTIPCQKCDGIGWRTYVRKEVLTCDEMCGECYGTGRAIAPERSLLSLSEWKWWAIAIFSAAAVAIAILATR